MPDAGRSLPADRHVHSEWSWDAPRGSMERSCARAVELGLPAIAFTEHVDHTTWVVEPSALDGNEHLTALMSSDGTVVPPPLDVAGFLESVESCRARYPGLRILSGVEVGEPHRHRDEVRAVLAAGRFDLVLGSLHSLPLDGGYAEPPALFARHDPADVLRDYLAETARLVAEDDAFEVLAHVDYPVRSWPAGRPFEPSRFEDAFRHALRAVAETGRALEVSTVVPLHATILRWWRQEGGQAISFGSDAHQPDHVARRFRDAMQMAEAHGFRPGRSPHDLWRRAR